MRYFIICVICCHFFCFNVIVTIIILQFTEIKQQKESGSPFMTKAHHQWLVTKRLTSLVRLDRRHVRPQGCRGRVQDFVTHRYFDWFINALIILNTMNLAMERYGATEEEVKWQDGIEYNFLYV